MATIRRPAFDKVLDDLETGKAWAGNITVAPGEQEESATDE